jgi:hypothetical protein
MVRVYQTMRETANGPTDEVRAWLHRRMAEVVDAGRVIDWARVTPAPTNAPQAAEAIAQWRHIELVGGAGASPAGEEQ